MKENITGWELFVRNIWLTEEFNRLYFGMEIMFHWESEKEHPEFIGISNDTCEENESIYRMVFCFWEDKGNWCFEATSTYVWFDLLAKIGFWCLEAFGVCISNTVTTCCYFVCSYLCTIVFFHSSQWMLLFSLKKYLGV